MRDYSFGNFLHELRERNGLSQYQLGMLVGVTGKAVSKWENGTAKPKSTILYKLSDVLGVTADELLACGYRSVDNENSKGVFAMKDKLWQDAQVLLREKYGENPGIRITNRWLTELAELKNSDCIIFMELARQIREMARERGGHVRVSEGMHSSLTAYIMGASEINPLPPHYYCPHCRKIEFSDEADCGWDLPSRRCACGREFERDGHDLPVESLRTILRSPGLLSLSVPREMYREVKEKVCAYFEGSITVSLVREDNRNFEKIVILPADTSGVTNGEILPVEKYLSVFWDYPSVSLMILDELDMYARLEAETNTSFDRIPFISSEITDEFIRMNTDGIYDFNGKFIRNMIEFVKPSSISDLIRVMGLSHGTGLYIGNAQVLISEGMPLSQVIAYREDIFRYIQNLMNAKGLYDTGFAFTVMDNTRRGIYKKNGIPEEMLRQFDELGVEPWFTESIGKIHYLLPKGTAAMHMRYKLILMWYKINYPEEFRRIFSEI